MTNSTTTGCTEPQNAGQMAGTASFWLPARGSGDVAAAWEGREPGQGLGCITSYSQSRALSCLFQGSVRESGMCLPPGAYTSSPRGSSTVWPTDPEPQCLLDVVFVLCRFVFRRLGAVLTEVHQIRPMLLQRSNISREIDGPL